MSKHHIVALMPFGLDHVEVSITFNYSPGRPAVWTLRNGDPGYPADPEEVEFCHAEPVGLSPDRLPPDWLSMINGWAEKHLAGDGYADAVDVGSAHAFRDEVA